MSGSEYPARVIPAPAAMAQLYTIPFSHYCELARWSLQIAKMLASIQARLHRQDATLIWGLVIITVCQNTTMHSLDCRIPFTEYPYLPGLHQFFSPVERIRARASEAGTGKGSGTPLYVSSSGDVFGDSWQVLQLTGLGDVPEDVFQTLNYVIGPHVRSILYSDILRDEMDGTFREIGKDAPVSCWQHFFWGLGGFRRTVAGKMWEQMVGDAERQAKVLAEFEEGICKLEAELAKPGSCFRSDGQLTASAIALAALFAPAVLPPEYTGGFVPEMKLESFSEGHQQRIKAWRARPLGQFTLEMYRKHRQGVVHSS